MPDLPTDLDTNLKLNVSIGFRNHLHFLLPMLVILWLLSFLGTFLWHLCPWNTTGQCARCTQLVPISQCLISVFFTSLGDVFAKHNVTGNTC